MTLTPHERTQVGEGKGAETLQQIGLGLGLGLGLRLVLRLCSCGSGGGGCVPRLLGGRLLGGRLLGGRLRGGRLLQPRGSLAALLLLAATRFAFGSFHSLRRASCGVLPSSGGLRGRRGQVAATSGQRCTELHRIGRGTHHLRVMCWTWATLIFDGKFGAEFDFKSVGRGEVVGDTFSRLRDPRRAKFRLSSDSDFSYTFSPKKGGGPHYGHFGKKLCWPFRGVMAINRGAQPKAAAFRKKGKGGAFGGQK